MGSRFDADFSFGRKDSSRQRPSRDEGPANILLIGDYSGSGDSALTSHSPLRINLESFEGVMARVGARLDLPGSDLPGEPLGTLLLPSLESLHPDGLFGSLGPLRALGQLRERMKDPALFPSVTAELKKPAPPPGQDDSTLERLLGRAPMGAGVQGARPADISAFLHRIVYPHIVSGPDPRQSEMLVSLERAMGDQMRAVLRQPALRRLEASWRAVRWLLDEIGDDEEKIALWLLDARTDEIARDAAAFATRLESAGAAAGGGWSLIVCDAAIGADEKDLRLLQALGKVAASLRAPLLSSALPTLAGAATAEEMSDLHAWRPLTPEVAEAWRQTRATPAARHVGLALPRFLLRLPYGRRTDPIERFAFEEMEEGAGPADLLWGNPAYLCARIAAREWIGDGDAGGSLEVSGLPAWTYTKDGAPAMAPCAEIYLPERAAEALLDRGLMPLVSQRGRPSVRLPRLQSIADPPAPLAGL